MFRVTLKGLLGHLPRLVSTFLAVLLGVAFLAGTLVLTDTIKRTFDDLFASVSKGTDAYVRSAAKLSGERGAQDSRARLDESVLQAVSRVDGVRADAPQVQGYAQLVDKKGKAMGTPGRGAPTFGGNWISVAGLNPFRLAEGSAPTSANDVVIDRRSARLGHFAVGDSITILLPNVAPQPYRVSGIATFGAADSPLGASYALFDLQTAERTMAQPGRIDGISLVAQPGVSQAELAARVQKVVPAGVEVKTGAEITKENQDQFSKNITGLTIFFNAFAVIALVVGGFVIYNTFSILIAQRLREMALLRAIGASRRQVLLSMVGEALAVGLVSSVAGVLLGIAVGAGLKALLAGFGLDIPATGLVVRPATVIIGLLVGTVVTLVAALAPSIRGARVPPIAAMRDTAIDRTGASRLRLVVGVLLTGLGVAAVLSGVLGSAAGSVTALGAVAVLVGVVALGPVVAAPVSRLIGSPIPKLKGITGVLARENAMRNPRRTAGTASALLIGVGVVSLLAAMASSFKASISDQISRSFTGDVTVDSGAFGFGGFSPSLAHQLNRLPEVAAATPIRFGAFEQGGSTRNVLVIDPQTLPKVLDLQVTAGKLSDLGSRQVAVYDVKAKSSGWKLGDTVIARFAETGDQTFTIAAMFHRNDIAPTFVMGTTAYDANVPNSLDQQIFVKFKSGVSFAAGRAAVEQAVKPYPNATVKDQQELKQTFTSQINQVLSLMFVMLLLALLIALMGIANTLRLSVYERTHEIGLLRAVGMTRSQLRSSIRWESAIIALFGTVGGVGLGVFFGWALVHGLGRDQHIVFAPPTGLLVTIFVLGALAGVAAAIRPAAKAAKLDVLTAIATE
ncbi:MAG TPA: FtsX-like permease family protein [Acidimicrobiales bacterium]|nr:FtsX-like permease family protein [Acidimicrobiales bacterium]